MWLIISQTFPTQKPGLFLGVQKPGFFLATTVGAFWPYSLMAWAAQKRPYITTTETRFFFLHHSRFVLDLYGGQAYFTHPIIYNSRVLAHSTVALCLSPL